MKRLSPIDTTFLRMESTRTPMHVGCLLTFTLPDPVPADFFFDLVESLRCEPFLPSPFDCRLSDSAVGRLLPAWVPAEIDIEYHVRHSALPRPGGERELGVLVSRLHSHPMDFDRPLWEMHVIEGLEGGRFAMYFKAHHCAIDGAGAMKMLKQWLKTDPGDMTPLGAMITDKKTAPQAMGLGLQLRQTASLVAAQAKGVGELVGKLAGMSRSGEDNMIRASMQTPRTVFNGQVWQQRRLGTQRLALSRFKAVAKKLDVTINDVTLALCGGAARAYLLEHGELPARTLTASVPIALEREPGEDAGNAVAGFVCPLATDESDPLRRLRRIHNATAQAKTQLRDMSRSALGNLALTGLAPLMLGQMTGTLARMPPMFNFVVSNVVLSKDALYLMGAELEAMYPMSFLFDGYALNVTVIGYAGHVAIGFIGCRDTIPKLQSLAVYAGEALTELEQAAGVAGKRRRSRPATARAGRKQVTRRRAGTRD